MKNNFFQKIIIVSLFSMVFPLSAFALNRILLMIDDLIWLASNILIAGSVLAMVIAGIMFVMGGSDPGKVETAKKMVIWSIIGVTTGFLARPILTWVASFFQ